ncbi:MAG TPA: hypothetical protein VHW03_10025 [Chthoniobacterales bacterium]|jgi:hypothetical protein|nr:hypothetical protein [Chthoniobacterales bacterium]
MKAAEILLELVIFAKERGADVEDGHLAIVVAAAERHIDAQESARERRRLRVSHKRECERCGRPSSSGILCWSCLSEAPARLRTAFRDAQGMEGVRVAAEKIRLWIKTSAPVALEQRRDAA